MKSKIALLCVFTLTMICLAFSSCAVSGKSDGKLEGSASAVWPWPTDSRPAGQ